MNFLIKIARFSYTKLIIGALLFSGGTFAGVYFGYALVEPKEEPPQFLREDQRYQTATEQLIKIKNGEQFPLEPFWDSLNNEIPHEQIFGKGITVLKFSSMLCNACEPSLIQWNKFIQPQIRDNVNLYICLPRGEAFFTPDELELFEGKKLIFYDQQLFNRKYNFITLPTTIYLDAESRIFDVQYGHSRYYHKEAMDLILE